MEKYICTLEIGGCEYKRGDKACLIDKPGCGFRIKEMIEMKESNQLTQKKKKWFEAYIK